MKADSKVKMMVENLVASLASRRVGSMVAWLGGMMAEKKEGQWVD